MTLTSDELTELLDRLLAGWENEVVEFKEAARQFSADKTGEIEEKTSKVSNLLTKMRRSGQILNTGTRAQSSWERA